MPPIPGDPLTGSLPRTQLIVPQDVLGPVRNKRTRYGADEWPRTADPQGYTIRQLRPGRIIAVRTRWGGIKSWKLRMVATSYQRRNNGRHFVVAMDRKGFCHSVWLDEVISVSTVQQAKAVLKAIRSAN